MVTKSIERAQKQVEAQNFSIRKHLLEYDDVMNKQRTRLRHAAHDLEGKNTREHLLRLVDEIVEWYADSYCSEKDSPSTGATRACRAPSRRRSASRRAWPTAGLGRDELVPRLTGRIRERYEERSASSARERMLFHQRMIMLQIVDTSGRTTCTRLTT